jgi:hypothetical protein
VSPEEKQALQFLGIQLEAARQALKAVNSVRFQALDKELKAMIDRLSRGGDVC